MSSKMLYAKVICLQGQVKRISVQSHCVMLHWRLNTTKINYFNKLCFVELNYGSAKACHTRLNVSVKFHVEHPETNTLHNKRSP